MRRRSASSLHVRSRIRHEPLAIRHPDQRERLGIEGIALTHDAIEIQHVGRDRIRIV
jgi:hypothetical protein